MSRSASGNQTYMIGRLEEALACDPRVNEQGLHVDVDEGTFVVTGTVSTPERLAGVEAVAADLLSGYPLRNEVTVSDYPELGEVEDIP